MKTLYLVRHAHAVSQQPGLTDFERPLSPQGVAEAHDMAAMLHTMGVCPEVMIASPATRTMMTAHIFCEQFGMTPQQIIERKDLYEGGTGRVSAILWQEAVHAASIMIFGHNPTMTAYSAFLVGEVGHAMEPCGVMRIDLPIPDWWHVDTLPGELRWYRQPGDV